MDIFVDGLPTHATEKQTTDFLRGHLLSFGIIDYGCDVFPGKNGPLANITVLDKVAGQAFVSQHGSGFRRPARQPITWGYDTLRIKISKTTEAELEMKLKTLQFDIDNKKALAKWRSAVVPVSQQGKTRFDIVEVDCGYWDFHQSMPVFVADYTQKKPGILAFGKEAAVALFNGPPKTRIDFDYWSCSRVVFGDSQTLSSGRTTSPCITFALTMPPKLYSMQDEVESLTITLQHMKIQINQQAKRAEKKSRELGLDKSHEKVAGTCLVYRFTFKTDVQLKDVKSLFHRKSRMPQNSTKLVLTYKNKQTWRESLDALGDELERLARASKLPLAVRFQIERFGRNAKIHPAYMLALIPKIRAMHKRHGSDITCYALMRLYRSLPDLDPYADAKYTASSLLQQLNEFVGTYENFANNDPYQLAKRHKHIVLVHRVIVTPTGVVLEGPDPEPANRVLRQYVTQQDHFVRLLFMDEDGGPLGFDSRADQDKVYFDRFRKVLDSGLRIAGTRFSFLGFSHSSLRAHSCWAMDPVWNGDQLWFADRLIKSLGDFDHIRIPAKCAARIGQNFTDTNTTVKLGVSNLGTLRNVERNGRDFSDGCGTISEALLHKVHLVYGQRRLMKPSVLQIRFQGAKGMVSLDERLEGEMLKLRPNMVKFTGGSTWDLEICGAGFRPLPMILNRSLIKILSDLGIPTPIFLHLQAQAVNALKEMTTSAEKVSGLLVNHLGFRSTGMLELIQMLSGINIQYKSDRFLQQIIEMAMTNLLQELKYRGRIPVKDGMTLYGIMDESGFLREGEIYVVTENEPEGGRKVHVQDRVLITRSPAMHPGDAQVVRAVDVPRGSMLRRLSNCVVFSQHGARDLASQLSGGDLDGDIYNVIFDRNLIPDITYEPADYPKLSAVELDEPVTRKDMSDFFVQFYKQDQLGLISNLHMQLADRDPMGTKSPACVELAGMASTAVDFSKTGIPVDEKKVRLFSRLCREKPHFMAPTPRIEISDDGDIDVELSDEDEEDGFEGLDVERRRKRYYRSYKELGQLFDAIDERQFLKDMRKGHKAAKNDAGDSVMPQLRDYILQKAHQYGILYKHHLELAKSIRERYENNLMEMLYCYGPTVRTPVTEYEAFSGHILGRRGGLQGKGLRDLSNTVRERLTAIIEHAQSHVISGDTEAHEEEMLIDLADPGDRVREAFPRAIAALVAGVDCPVTKDPLLGEIKSFTYVAASVCLTEFKKYMITTFGDRTTLPSVKNAGGVKSGVVYDKPPWEI